MSSFPRVPFLKFVRLTAQPLFSPLPMNATVSSILPFERSFLQRANPGRYPLQLLGTPLRVYTAHLAESSHPACLTHEALANIADTTAACLDAWEGSDRVTHEPTASPAPATTLALHVPAPVN